VASTGRAPRWHLRDRGHARRSRPIGHEPVAAPGPVLALATQNPIEFERRYPLPEAQVDRLMVKRLGDRVLDGEMEDQGGGWSSVLSDLQTLLETAKRLAA
jgi:hypothetical protein